MCGWGWADDGMERKYADFYDQKKYISYIL
jgi:hypothetical protein